MIAVLFEVWPAEGRTQHYLDLAAALKDELSQLDGFVSIERFESLSEPGKLLSLSVFAMRKPSPSGATPPGTA
jgi:heme-degrading monooxygenase HmoA